MSLELSEAHQVAKSIAEIATTRKVTIAVAESLTSGSITMCLGAATNAQKWFNGGITAYTPETKVKVLGVGPGPVVTAQCATEMAQGVCRLTGATISVAVTGVGGPEPEEGKAAGTVFIAVWDGTAAHVEEHHFAGAPETVLEQTILHALGLLREVTTNAGAPPNPGTDESVTGHR